MLSRASCSTQTLKYSCSSDPIAQHEHQILVLQSFFLNTNFKYSYAPELPTRHKNQILIFFRACAQHKHLINYVLQGPRPTHEIIYIKHMQLAYSQYIKQIIILMCSGILCPIYKTKHYCHVQWGMMPNIQNKTSTKHHNKWDL